MLVADTAIPTFQPGMIWKVPGWLAVPLGPLTVKASDLPRALPWLWRHLRSGTRDGVFQPAAALRALHRSTLVGWRDTVGDAAMSRLTHQHGQAYLWASDAHNEDRSRPPIVEGHDEPE